MRVSFKNHHLFGPSLLGTTFHVSLPSQVSTWITISAVLVLVVAPKAEALETSLDMRVMGQLAQVDQFGFGAGGSANLEVTLVDADQETSTSNPHWMLLDCTHPQFLAVPGRTPRLEQSNVCGRIRTSNATRPTCSGWAELTPGQTTVYQAEYSETALHHFLIVNCGGSTLPMTVDYQLLGSDNTTLSLDEAPLPYVYAAVALIWVSMTVRALANHKMTHQGLLKPIHRSILVVTIVKAAAAAGVAAHWALCWRGPNCNPLAATGALWSDATAQAVLFALVLSLTRGWVVLYPKYAKSNWAVVGASSGIVMFALVMLRSLEADPSLSLALLYFFLLPYLYTTINDCTTVLEGHSTLLGFVQEDVDPARPAALASKLEVYEGFQSSLVVYLMVLMFSNLMRMMLPWHMAWVTTIFPELLYVGAVLALSKVFAPSRLATSDAFSPIPFLPDLHLQTALSTLTASRFAAMDAQAQAQAAAARATPSERAAEVPAPVHPGQMVLVQLPCVKGDEPTMYAIGTEEKAWNQYKAALAEHYAREAKGVQDGEESEAAATPTSPGGMLSPSGSSVSSMSSLWSVPSAREVEPSQLAISVSQISLTSPHVLADDGQEASQEDGQAEPQSPGVELYVAGEASTPRGYTPVALEEDDRV